MKTCRKCGIEQMDDQFSKAPRNRDGLGSYCRECLRKDDRERWALNKNGVRERKAKWVKDNPEKVEATLIKYHTTHLEQERVRCRNWRAANREKARAAVSNWMKNHPEEVRVRNHQQKAQKLGARGEATSEQIQARIDVFGGMCAYCGQQPWKHIDHAIAISRGGTNWPANLRPACSECNLRKHANTWRLVTFGSVAEGARVGFIERAKFRSLSKCQSMGEYDPRVREIWRRDYLEACGIEDPYPAPSWMTYDLIEMCFDCEEILDRYGRCPRGCDAEVGQQGLVLRWERRWKAA